MRIIIMGTGPFAVPSCERLLADGFDVPLVVTRPLSTPPPKKLPPRPVYDWAVQNGLTIFEPDSINAPESMACLREIGADLLFVCDYGQILSKEALTTSKLGGINLHGSILPRHRGAAPVQWTLLQGDTTAGVTVIHMTPGLDAGPALSVQTTDVHPDENAGELEPRLALLGVEAVKAAVEQLSSWDGQSPLGKPQDRSAVTRAPRFAKSDGQLDCRLPAEYLVRLILATQPWPGAFAEVGWPSGKSIRVNIRAARSYPDTAALRRLPIGGVQPATAEQLGQTWPEPYDSMLAVATSEGWLLISQIQPAGKRTMSAAEFMRGHAIGDDVTLALPTTPQLALA